MSEKTVKKLEFNIFEIKKINHFEKDFKEYNLDSSDITKGKMNLNLGIGFDQKEELAIINIKINCFTIDEKYLLYGIESVYKFKIKNLNKDFRNEEIKSYQLPDALMEVLLSISISGTRGMLAVLNITPEYQKIYFPVVPTKMFIQDFKKKNKS